MEVLTVSSIIISIVLMESFAQYCIKKSKTCTMLYFIAGVIAYIGVCILLFQSYNYKPMGIINTLWSAASIILVIMIGAYFYNEKLLLADYIGILLVILGIFFIFIYGHT